MYYDINQLQTLKEFTDTSSLSLSHLKISFLKKNIDDLEHLIQLTKVYFDTIAVSEWRSIKDKLPVAIHQLISSLTLITFFLIYYNPKG